MASTPGYQPRVRVNVGRADPALGPQTAIAEGIGELGRALGGVADDRAAIEEARAASQYRIDAEQQRRDRSAMIADRAGAWAVEQGALREELEEAKKTSAPGAADWPDRANEIVDARLSKFLDTLGDDPEVRQRFEPMVADVGMRFIGRENDWARAKKFEHEKNGNEAWVNQRILQLEEDGDLQAAFDDFDLLASGMDWDATTKETLTIAVKQQMVERLGRAQNAGGNAAGWREAMKSPDIQKYLTPESREALLADGFRAEDRAAADAEAAASRQRDAARDQVKAIKALLDAGAEPTPAQMRTLGEAAKLLPADEQIDIAAIDTQLAVNRATRGQASPSIRRERDRLRAKADAGAASQTEQMMLKAYDTRLDSAEDEEAETVKAALGNGAAGRIAAIGQAQGLDPASRFAVLEKAEPGLGHVALLPTPMSRQMAIEGAEIRKAQSDLVPEKEAKAAFRQNVGSVGALLGDTYDDKMAIAMDLYAHHAARTAQKGFNANLFWQYTNVAFGATKRADGSWQGGLGTVNGVRTVLPDQVSQGELRTAIARTDWSAARDRHGRPVAKGFITGKMAPKLEQETATHTIYRMVDPTGSELKADDGRTLFLRVANGVR